MTDDKKNQEGTNLVKETLERLANALMFDKKHYDDLLVENQALKAQVDLAEKTLSHAVNYLISMGITAIDISEPDRQMYNDFVKTLAEIQNLRSQIAGTKQSEGL